MKLSMFLIIIECFLLWIINTSFFHRAYNYANCFIGLWTVISFLSMCGFYDFYIPPESTYLYIAFMLLVFEIATLFGYKVRFGNKKNRRILSNYEDTRVLIKSIPFTLINMVCTAFLIPYVRTGLSYIFVGGFNSLRQESLRTLYSTGTKLVLMNIVQPIILASLIIGFWNLIRNRKFNWYIIIALLNSVLYILVFASRWILMEILMLLFVIVVQYYGGHIFKVIKDHKFLVAIGIFIVLIIITITAQRSVSSDGGVFKNIYTYFVGSIHLFGVACKNPSDFLLHDSSGYLYGGELLSGITDVVFMVTNRIFHTDFVTGISVLNNVTQKFYSVAPNVVMNNNFTMVYAFLRDGGLLGILFDTSILACVYAKIYKNRDSSLFYITTWCYMKSMALFLVFEWMFARTSMIMVPVALYFLTRPPFVKERKAVG